MIKRGLNNGLLGLACISLLTGCIRIATPTPYPTHTPYPTYTPQPTLAFPLSKYEGERVSMMYPTGWIVEEEPGSLFIGGPSACGSILVTWTEQRGDVAQTAEDRYKEQREIMLSTILTAWEDKPQFEVLREYRLGDAPVFEHQHWDEEFDCIWNVQIMSYTDPQIRQSLVGGWSVLDCCGAAEWHQEMGVRRALFDTVMQSITFRYRLTVSPPRHGG